MIMFSIQGLFAQESKENNSETKTNSTSKEDFYILSPGAIVRMSTLSIENKMGSEAQFQYVRPVIDGTLYARTPVMRLGDYTGLYLAFQSTPYSFKTQHRIDWLGLTKGGTGYYGSEVHGNSNYFIPTYMIGSKEKDGFRVGVGIGIGTVTAKGFAIMDHANEHAAQFLSLQKSRDALPLLSAYTYQSGAINFKADPIYSFYASNLSANHNLRDLGFYMLTKGILKPDKSDRMMLLYTEISAPNPAGYSQLERLTILALRRTPISSLSQPAASILVYYEFPSIGKFRVRYYGLMQYTENKEQKFMFTDINWIVYYPIAL